MHRFADTKEAHEGCTIGGTSVDAAVGCVLWEERRVFFLAVIDNETSVVVGGQEESFGVREPFDIRYSMGIDYTL
jgi:hypothetical protein